MTTNEKFQSESTLQDSSQSQELKRINYRKRALMLYGSGGKQIVCFHCGFGILAVLDVAHLDFDHSNCHDDNLGFLCPTCHRMYDLGLIAFGTISEMQPADANWRKTMKGAGAKAAASRQKTLLKRKHQVAANKAVATRRKNARVGPPS